MAPYHERFPVGTHVAVASRERLEEFARTWRFHHPLTAEQVSFAGRGAIVCEVSFYHGGDVLYALDGVPGIWHEQCVLGSDDKGAA